MAEPVKIAFDRWCVEVIVGCRENEESVAALKICDGRYQTPCSLTAKVWVWGVWYLLRLNHP
jgi:hypothetical protein